MNKELKCFGKGRNDIPLAAVWPLSISEGERV